MGPTTFVAVILALIVASILAEPTGPPIANNADLCKNMFPAGHEAVAQTGTPPVTVEVHSCYKENMELEVEVKHNSANLKGIFVQARVGTEAIPNTDTTDPIGTFKSAGDPQPMQAYTCKVDNDAWGHNARLSSKEVEFKWVAPAASAGDVRIVVTAVQDKATFWTFVQSSTISFDANCTAPAPAPGPTPSSVSIMSLNLGLLALTLLAALGRQ